MKLFNNIYGILTVIGGMNKLKENRIAIENAKASGDVKKEQEEILKACQIWSSHIVDEFKVDFTVIHPEIFHNQDLWSLFQTINPMRTY